MGCYFSVHVPLGVVGWVTSLAAGENFSKHWQSLGLDRWENGERRERAWGTGIVRSYADKIPDGYGLLMRRRQGLSRNRETKKRRQGGDSGICERAPKACTAPASRPNLSFRDHSTLEESACEWDVEAFHQVRKVTFQKRSMSILAIPVNHQTRSKSRKLAQTGSTHHSCQSP